MADDDDNLKIKHYRATDDSRGRKQLITEMVVDDSDTFLFLERMEEKRLSKPCRQDLDMRGKVAGECKRYRYQGRDFYLDEDSLKLYKELMHDSGGEFTTRIYENVINAKHTFRAMKRAQIQAQNKNKKRIPRSSDAAKKKPAKVVGTAASNKARQFAYQPEQIQFGYYYQRQERRLKYATKVQLRSVAGNMIGNTKDISCGGLYLVIPARFVIDEGLVVTIEFTRQKGETTAVDLSHVPFTVLEVVEKDEKTYLRLKLREEYDEKDAFREFFSDFIRRHSGRNKFCMEDDYITQVSLLMEKMYCDNMAQIPIFIGKSKKGKYYLQLIGRSLGNAYLLHYFRRVGGFDMSVLTLPHRLAAILNQPDLLIAMYRAGKSDIFKTHSLARNECDTSEQWDAFVRYALRQKECRVLKICGVTEVFPDPEAKKLQSAYSKYPALEDIRKLTQQLRELHAFAVVADVTNQIEEWYQVRQNADKATTLQQLRYWFGRKYVEKGKLKKNAEKIIKPHFAELAYRESRVEARYFVDFSIELMIAGKQYSGKSKDLSVHGLQVEIPGVINDVGDHVDVLVGLVSLQKKRSNIDLSRIPYHLVAINADEKAAITQFKLYRHEQGRKKEIDHFFNELIEANRAKLPMCTNDWHNDVLSRTYESICGDALQSIPLFLAKEASGSIIFNAVAIAASSCTLAQFFQPLQYDFSCFNRPAVNAMIYEKILQILREAESALFRPEPFEVIYYLSKEYDEDTESVVIEAKADCEFADIAQKQAYRERVQAAGHDYRWVKLTATFVSPLPPEEIDVAVAVVRKNDKNRANQLREFVSNCIGVAELIDITDIIPSASVPDDG